MWQYYRNDPHDILTNSESFKFKINITGKTPAARITKNVKIAVSLKYLSNFWRTLEMLLINCEINLVFTWSEIILFPLQLEKKKFAITDTKDVPLLTLSTQDNAKLLEQWRSGFKRAINWNKCQSKVSRERQSQYWDFLIDLRFHRVNRFIVLYLCFIVWKCYDWWKKRLWAAS